MRILKILAVVLVGAAALMGVASFVLARYLESETFRRAAVGAAQEALGAPVTVGEMHVSLFSGATFRQVVVGNPPGLKGELLRADALVVRPRLLPLLRRRLEIAELRLDEPAITLIRNDRGEWSFDRLVSRPAPAPSPPAAGATGGAETPPAMPVAPVLDVVVPRLAVRRGTLAVARESKGVLVGASGIEVTTALSRVGGALAGQGDLAVESLRIADRVEVRALTAPIRFSGGELTLSPVRAQPERTARGPGDPQRHRGGAHRTGARADPRRPPPRPPGARRRGRRAGPAAPSRPSLPGGRD